MQFRQREDPRHAATKVLLDLRPSSERRHDEPVRPALEPPKYQSESLWKFSGVPPRVGKTDLVADIRVGLSVAREADDLVASSVGARKPFFVAIGEKASVGDRRNP